MTKDIITFEQLPVITERFEEIKCEIESAVNNVIALECNESSYSEYKKQRAALNKLFNEYEDMRKGFKKAIMAYYDPVEEKYKEYVSAPCKAALNLMDENMAVIEQKIISEKTENAKKAFEASAKVKGIWWLDFERLGIKIGLSTKDSDIVKQFEDALANISLDLKAIALQDYPDEVLYEYKRTLNIASAIREVKIRHASLEDSKSESDSDIFEEVFGTENNKDEVVYEDPKREYVFKFNLTEKEYVQLINAISKLDYKEVK